MTTTLFNPIANIERLRRQMDDLFGAVDPRWSQQAEAPVGSAWAPAVDIYQSDDEIVLMAELPGLTRDDVKVNIDDGVLTISGERKLPFAERRDRYTRIERAYGQFSREFRIPDVVDVDRVQARMENGVLTIHLPKREEARPRQIQVNVS